MSSTFVSAHSEVSNYHSRISVYPLLTPAEEVALAERVQAGDLAARNTLIQSNLRLVVKIAGTYSSNVLQPMDLICEGNLGLIKAAERFKPTGAKFSVYCLFWVRQSILRALAHQGRTVRLPAHVLPKLSLINATRAKLEHELGRECHLEDISHATGIPLNKLANLHNVSQPAQALDAPVGEGAATFGDLLPDTQDTPQDQAELDSDRDMLAHALDTLPPREVDIMKRRYGLDGYDPHTLEELGNYYSLTRERIRQIHDKCIRKLTPICLRGQSSRTQLDLDVRALSTQRLRIKRGVTLHA